MSNPSGFEYYDMLISRLHGGVCAFQSLRSHRRGRAHHAPEPAAAPPSPVRAATSESAGDEHHAPPLLEPQGFVNINGRVMPLFGAIPTSFIAAPVPAPEGSPTTSAPRHAPPVHEPAPAQESPPPRPATTSTLNLPPPIPPPRLGLVYSRNAPAVPDVEPASAPTQPAPNFECAPPPTAQAFVPDTELEDPHTATPVQDAPDLDAILAIRAQAEATRLEQVHADHRASLASLLHEHRAQLQAQAEADANRTTQVLRELLAEHRTELATAAAVQADRLAQVLTQHREDMVTLQIEQRDASTDQARQCDDLRATLAEQAQLQREAHEDVAQHISTLSSIVADLGHTVGLLAMAAYRGQQGRPTAAPTFAPPPPLTKPTSPNTGAATAPPPASAPAAPPQPVPSVSSPSPIVRPGDSAAPDAAQTTMIEARMPEVAHAFVARPPAANLEGPASNAREPPKINSAAPARGEDSVLDFASELANDDELVQDVIDPDDAPRRGGLAPVTTLVIDDLKEIMHV